MPDGFTHDFDPAIAQVFGLHLYWYGAVYTVGFLGIFGWFLRRRARLDLSVADVLDLSIALALGVLLGGRIFDILVYEFDYYRDHPLHAADWWRGGLATHGVLLGSVASLYLFCRRRRSFLRIADELSVPAAFLLCVGRIGNFIEGGVVGTATQMPWGVHYPDLAGPRHPVALYESAKNLLIVPALVLTLKRYPAGRGVALALFVVLYAGLRFLVDLLRDYEAYWLGLDTGQYFNLLMAILGGGLLVWARRRGDRIDAPPTPRPTRAKRVGWLRPIVFALLCLYPLGIPTSWTQINIEEKRRAPAQVESRRRVNPLSGAPSRRFPLARVQRDRLPRRSGCGAPEIPAVFGRRLGGREVCNPVPVERRRRKGEPDHRHRCDLEAAHQQCHHTRGDAARTIGGVDRHHRQGCRRLQQTEHAPRQEAVDEEWIGEANGRGQIEQSPDPLGEKGIGFPSCVSGGFLRALRDVRRRNSNPEAIGSTSASRGSPRAAGAARHTRRVRWGTRPHPRVCSAAQPSPAFARRDTG